MQTAGSNGIMERAPGQQGNGMLVGAEASDRAYGEPSATRRGGGGVQEYDQEEEEGEYEDQEPSGDEYGTDVQYVEDLTSGSELEG